MKPPSGHSTTRLLSYRPGIFQAWPEVTAAESRRGGGTSPAPYHSLNLGNHTEDTAERVAENRRRFFNHLGWPAGAFASSYQVHGCKVLLAEEAVAAHGYDAVITQRAGLMVGVTVADCTPILIYDPKHRAVAAVHAGWRGSAQGIAPLALQAMAEAFGTRAEDCWAYIGTCISQTHYEVDEQVAQAFLPAHRKPGRKPEKWMLCLKSANLAQLSEAGLPESQIETSPYCTWADGQHYFSHRREGGITGRMLAVIGVQNLK